MTCQNCKRLEEREMILFMIKEGLELAANYKLLEAKLTALKQEHEKEWKADDMYEKEFFKSIQKQHELDKQQALKEQMVRILKVFRNEMLNGNLKLEIWDRKLGWSDKRIDEYFIILKEQFEEEFKSQLEKKELGKIEGSLRGNRINLRLCANCWREEYE